jgi:hypothetical protein
MATTLSKFGVPLGGTDGRGGILQPKVKWKWRVRVVNFGPIAGGIEFTQQVQSVNRPQVQQDAVEVHSYNSTAYYAGKAKWQSVELSVRDDVTNSVSRLVGHQVQKQMNHFEQTSFLSGQNYKFQMFIENMDGGNDAVLEQWFLEGCWLEQVNYDQMEYSSNDPLLIQMSVRYDNATQSGGLMPTIPDLIPGSLIG